MIIPLVKNSIFEYSLKEDTTEPKTIFQLRYLTARQKAIWMVLSTQYVNQTTDSRAWWFTMVKIGIAGWKNLNTNTGTPYEYKTEKFNIAGFGEIDIISDDLFDAFPIETIRELAEKIYDINNPTLEEKKSI
jgi:hypothetical protein